MRMRNLLGVLLAAFLMTGAAGAQNDSGAKQEMKNAGHETAAAGRDAGNGVKQGSKKAYHKTKRGTKKTAHKVHHAVDPK